MGRVCGNLAVSRALGDFEYKDRKDLPAAQQKITADSDTTIIARVPEDEFLLLACDGIWVGSPATKEEASARNSVVGGGR
jgi:serine/threonine protein phosphatase PrpC